MKLSGEQELRLQVDVLVLQVAELRGKLAEQESRIYKVTHAKEEELSAAKQEGYEQGWDNASYSVSKDVEQARAEGKQAGRDEVLRELSEQKPVAWRITNSARDGLYSQEDFTDMSFDYGRFDALIIRPSAPMKYRVAVATQGHSPEQDKFLYGRPSAPEKEVNENHIQLIDYCALNRMRISAC